MSKTTFDLRNLTHQHSLVLACGLGFFVENAIVTPKTVCLSLYRIDRRSGHKVFKQITVTHDGYYAARGFHTMYDVVLVTNTGHPNMLTHAGLNPSMVDLHAQMLKTQGHAGGQFKVRTRNNYWFNVKSFQYDDFSDIFRIEMENLTDAGNATRVNEYHNDGRSLRSAATENSVSIYFDPFNIVEVVYL